MFSQTTAGPGLPLMRTRRPLAFYRAWLCQVNHSANTDTRGAGDKVQSSHNCGAVMWKREPRSGGQAEEAAGACSAPFEPSKRLQARLGAGRSPPCVLSTSLQAGSLTPRGRL